MTGHIIDNDGKIRRPMSKKRKAELIAKQRAMTKSKPPRREKPVKAWALRFIDDNTLYPTGAIPELFATRRHAMELRSQFNFVPGCDPAVPVRVEVHVVKP